MSEAPAKTWSLAQALDAVSVEKLEAALRSATISATGCVDGGERRIISAIEWDDYRILLERSFFLNNDFFGGPPTIIVEVISRRSFPARSLKDHSAPSGIMLPCADSSSGEPGYHRVITDVRIPREQVERVRDGEPGKQAVPLVPSAMDSKTWITSAIKRRKPDENVTDFARRMELEMAAATAAGECSKSWTFKTIVNRIGEYKLWPE